MIGRTVGAVQAVDGVSFEIPKGKTMGLVGESGCGKSTLARTILQLIEPTSGSIMFDGQEIAGLGKRQMRPLRREMQMIFQDPYASLNPRKRVGPIIGEMMAIHGIGNTDERRKEVEGLLDRVGLSAEHYNRYPHEFSRRPTPASRRRARARAQAEADHRRRARIRARRLDPGPDHHPPRGPSGRVRPHLPLRRPRPWRRPPRRGHRRRDVSGEDRRNGTCR